MRACKATRFADEGIQLQDGVPVASCTSGAKLSFKEGIGQMRATNPGRIHNVGLSALRANHFRSSDGGPQRLDLFLNRRPLQKHDDETRRVAFGFVLKWIVSDDPLPLLLRANKEVGVKIEALSQPPFLGSLQDRLQFVARCLEKQGCQFVELSARR